MNRGPDAHLRYPNQAGRFVALAEEAEQMLGAYPIQREIAQLIDNDQVAKPESLNDRNHQLGNRRIVLDLIRAIRFDQRDSSFTESIADKEVTLRIAAPVVTMAYVR